MIHLNHTENRNTVDILPCSIEEHNGRDDVDKYFIVRDEEDGSLHSSLRGRHLVGSTHNLDENVKGFILRGNSDDSYEIESEVDSFRVWGHDIKVSNESNPIEQSNRLFKISSKVCKQFLLNSIFLFIFIFSKIVKRNKIKSEEII